MRAERLRANGGFLRPEAFQARKEFLVAKDTGALHEQVRVYVLKCVTRNVLCAGPAQQHEPHTALLIVPPSSQHTTSHRTCRAP